MDKFKYIRKGNESESQNSKMIKEFGFLFRNIILILVVLYIFFDFCLQLYVQFAPQRHILRLENLIETLAPVRQVYLPTEYKTEIKYLNDIKNKIIEKDKNLQYRKNYKISVVKSSEMKAFIDIGGNLYFTSACFDKIKDKEILAFILAHEFGHYSQRHTLEKITGRITLLGNLGLVKITGNKNLASLVDKAVGFQEFEYSERQENAADLYAINMLEKLYGNKNAAMKFFIAMEQNPEDYKYLLPPKPTSHKRIQRLKGIRLAN